MRSGRMLGICSRLTQPRATFSQQAQSIRHRSRMMKLVSMLSKSASQPSMMPNSTYLRNPSLKGLPRRLASERCLRRGRPTKVRLSRILITSTTIILTISWQSPPPTSPPPCQAARPHAPLPNTGGGTRAIVYFTSAKSFALFFYFYQMFSLYCLTLNLKFEKL